MKKCMLPAVFVSIFPFILINSCMTGIYESDPNTITRERNRIDQQAAEFSAWAQTMHSPEPAPLIQLGHNSRINSVSFSPDGKYAVSGSQDETIRIWDISRGYELARTSTGYFVNTAIFSADGKYILSGGTGKTVDVWSVPAMNRIASMKGHEGDIQSLAVSSDGKHLLSASVDSTVRLWDMEKFHELMVMKRHTKIVRSVAFSSDNRFALSAADDTKVIMWDISTGKIIRTIPAHFKDIMTLAVSPDGRFFATGSIDGRIKLWEMETGKLVKTMKGKKVFSLLFSPDSRYLFSNELSALKTWDLSAGEVQRVFNPEGVVLSLDVSSDGESLIFSKSMSNTIHLMNVASGEEIQILGENRNSRNFPVAYSPDGSSFISIFSGGINLWDASEFKIRQEIRFSSWAGMDAVAVYSPDSRFLLYTPFRKLYLWDIAEKTVKIEFDEYGETITSLAYSPDGGNVVSGAEDGSLTLWDVRSGKKVREIFHHNKAATTVIFSPEGQSVLSGFSDGSIFLVDINTGRQIQKYEGLTKKINSLKFSPDGNSFYSVSSLALDGLCIWDVNTAKKLETIHLFSGGIYPREAAISPDGKFGAETLGDRLRIWDLKSREKHKEISCPGVNSLCFSPDSRYLLSGSNDGSMKLWNTVEGNLVFTFISNSRGDSLLWIAEGYFSGSPSFAKEAVCIVDGFFSYSFDQFFDVFYRPDIIRGIIAGKDPDPRILERNLGNLITALPEVSMEIAIDGRPFVPVGIQEEMAADREREVLIRVNARDLGGGAEDIRLFHNGSRVAGDTKGLSIERKDTGMISEIYALTLAPGKNNISAIACASTGLETRPITAVILYAGPQKNEPALYVLSIGINAYQNSRYNLNYAVNDAQQFVRSLGISGNRLFSIIESTIIIDKEATKGQIMASIESIREKAHPEDVFIFFYSGHGIALDHPALGREEFFFILPAVTQMTDIEKVLTLGISGPEFQSLLSSIPARKQFLVLDACNAGAINTAFGIRGAAEEIALSRLSRSAGSALIAASRDDQFAQEFAVLGQGALTKTLLDGLAGAAATVDGQITVGSLKSYVEAQLPFLTRKYAGREQYPTGFIFGQDFPIGLKE